MLSCSTRLVIHSAHAAARHRWHRRFLLGQFGDHRLGRDQKAGDRRRILKSASNDLSRIYYALRDKVSIFASLCVITVRILFLFHDLANHNRTVGAGIDRDLARRGLDRLTHDLDTMLLILIFGAQAFKCLDRAEQGYAATRQNAFLDSGASCMHRVIDPIFALLYFSLSRSADADYRYSACEFSQRFFAGTTTIVVLSLSIVTVFARPSILMVAFSSFMPRSSDITWPPVRIAVL